MTNIKKLTSFIFRIFSGFVIVAMGIAFIPLLGALITMNINTYLGMIESIPVIIIGLFLSGYLLFIWSGNLKKTS